MLDGPWNVKHIYAKLAGKADEIGLRKDAAGLIVLPQVLVDKHQNHSLPDIRCWHWDVLSGLLISLREQLSADSPLIEHLSDYALLLQAARAEKHLDVERFQIRELADESLRAAKQLYPADARIQVSAMVQPSGDCYWQGHSVLLRALMKHLLLIGMKRTRVGFVYLRILIQPLDNGASKLTMVMEDSGAKLQPAQLQSWLTPASSDCPPADVTGDISWLLAVQLVHYLGGNIDARCGGGGGLTLECSTEIWPGSADIIAPQFFIPMTQVHTKPPLVMIVEDGAGLATAERVFSEAGCQVFLVETHAQALEWATALPFSAIMLNTSSLEKVEDTARRLGNFKDDGLIPDLPLWLSVAKISFIESDYWRRFGFSELLIKPLHADALRRLATALTPCDPLFYQNYNARLREDFPVSIIASLPEMNRLLAGQVAMMDAVLQALAEGEDVPLAPMQAHAVKSAALTMGYSQLAALMAGIEHASVAKSFSKTPQNWLAIAEAIVTLQFDKSKPSK